MRKSDTPTGRVSAPAWTISTEPNEALSNQYGDWYTLYYCGLVRGQLLDKGNAQRIADQLNLANVEARR
jgi:hypothetical protein